VSHLPNYKLELPYVPPSQNQRRGEHWAKTRARKKKLQDDLFVLMLAEKLPKGLTRVHATASIRLPQNRRRDEGNYRDALEKALGDALQLQWLPDDTPEFFTFGALTFEEETGAARTTITLEVERA
jgi:hypothetical protein